LQNVTRVVGIAVTDLSGSADEQVGFATVTCPTGVLIAGGFEITGPAGVQLSRRSTPNPNQWVVMAVRYRDSMQNVTVQAFAMCAT
jgi:hypothetical protein